MKRGEDDRKHVEPRMVRSVGRLGRGHVCLIDRPL